MHIPPKAFDPIVLIMPESKFNAYAITAISTLIKILPRPISAMDAIYRARCAENAGFISRYIPELPVNTTAIAYSRSVKTNSLRTGLTSRFTAKDMRIWFHFANSEVASSNH
jgi:hypothetical protein